MNAAALNSLWTYLQSLQLTQSNRKWLAEHLVEPTPVSTVEEDETEYIKKSPAMMKIIEEGRQAIKEGNYEVVDIDELWK